MSNQRSKKYVNEMQLSFKAISENESFSRVAIASFITPLNPTIAEMTDIKTAVSEAVTNAIIHGYENGEGEVFLYAKIVDREVYIEVSDKGIGIKDLEEARTPLFTSKPEQERSGMGFTVIETFMDKMQVYSTSGVGTKIIMTKKL